MGGKWMKVAQLIKIMDIDEKDKFIKYQYNNGQYKEKFSICSDGIHYWYDEEIGDLEVKEYQNTYRSLQNKYINKNTIILNAIFLVLLAYGKWKEMQCDIFNKEKYIIEKMDTNLKVVEEYFIKNLDFSQVTDMKDLTSIISKDNKYRTYKFFVSIYDYDINMKKPYIRFGDKKELEFGSMINDDLDKVFIDIYTDEGKLHYVREGYRSLKNVCLLRNNKELTLEEKIINIISGWKNSYDGFW